MAANVGSQIVTLIYFTPAVVETVNNRQKEIQPVGIYKGGYLTVIDGSHCQLSPLVCEIGDGTYQVKIETGATVSITVAPATPYIVLRWVHDPAVQSNDYMDFMVTATPAANDLVVAKCLFTSGVLTDFSYGDVLYPRSFPKQPRLYLKVESTGASELRVRIRGGYVQGNAGSTFVPDQKSSSIVAPTSTSKVYLICVDPDTGIIAVDSTGTENVSPTAPAYAGRLVLAEITLAVGATSIPDSKIKDVRPFVSVGSRPLVDNNTLVYNSGIMSVNRLPIATLPRYTIKWHNGAATAAPSTFTSITQTGSLISLGTLLWGIGLSNGTVETMFQMTVNNITGSTRTISQLLAYCDDSVYCWLNGVQIHFWAAGAGKPNYTFNWPLIPGSNLIQIIHVDIGGNSDIMLIGDFVDDTHVTFVS